MIKFLLKEVHANSSGNGTKGFSKKGKGNNRPADSESNKSAKAMGSKRKHLTTITTKKKKGQRPFDF